MSDITPRDAKLFGEFRELARDLGPEASELWGDAFAFMKASGGKRIIEKRRKRYLRAAVVTAAAAFEGWTNFLAASVIAKPEIVGRALTEFELDCLCEKQKKLDGGAVRESQGRYRSQDRFLLLLGILNGERELPKEPGLRTSFQIRDRLVHPKPGGSVAPSDLHDAFFGFLGADIDLGIAWKKAKSIKPPRPRLVQG